MSCFLACTPEEAAYCVHGTCYHLTAEQSPDKDLYCVCDPGFAGIRCEMAVIPWCGDQPVETNIHNKSGYLTWLWFRAFWLHLVAWLYSALNKNLVLSTELTTPPPTQHHSFFRNYPFIHFMYLAFHCLNGGQVIIVLVLDIEYFTSPFPHSEHGWKSWPHLL